MSSSIGGYEQGNSYSQDFKGGGVAFPLFFLSGRYKISLIYKDGSTKIINKNFNYEYEHDYSPFCFKSDTGIIRESCDINGGGIGFINLDISKPELQGLKKIDLEYDIDYLYEKYLQNK